MVSAHIEIVLFVVMAMAAVMAAVAVVLQPRVRLAAVALLVSAAGVSVLLLTLRFPIAAVALLVSAAGVSVLLLAVLRIVDPRGEVPVGKGESFQRGMALFAAACLLGLLGLALRRSRDPFAIVAPDGERLGNLLGFGRHLLGGHLVSLGLTGLLLAVTLAGAVVLGRSFLGTRGRP